MNYFNSTFKVKPPKAKPRPKFKPKAKPQPAQRPSGVRPGKGIKARPDRKLVEWSRKVKKRDENQCQFRKAFDSCRTGDVRIDPHHIAPRGRRPDLIYDVRNGICLCRTHHDWCHDNPMDAEREGYLNFDSYELAQKLKAGYTVPGDEHDTRITL